MKMDISPCPFCGREAQLCESVECYGHGDYARASFVQCRACGAKGPIYDDHDYDVKQGITRQAAATLAWNIRKG